uniref:Tudor domain-containing protein n=1 Tax=Heterorhabditis bacteriophora TaxID=37862 RepID=A0A1I7WCN3_HETBA
MSVGPGWNIDENILIDLIKGDLGETLNQATIEKKLCDLDLRDIGQPSISNCVNKEAQILIGPTVLQISKYRNTCLPKLRQESQQNGGIIRLFLTDGHNSISALVLENINGINADTPPGTKVLIIGNVPIENNFILLDRKNVTVLGGRVDKLIEKWIIEKNSGQDGRKSKTQAPKWVSFSKVSLCYYYHFSRTILFVKSNAYTRRILLLLTRIFQKDSKVISNLTPNNFKANEVIHAATKKSINDDSQFEQQRKETIEAIEETTTKKFAAPNIPVPLNKHRPTEQKKIKEKISDRTAKKRIEEEEEEVVKKMFLLMGFTRPSAPCTLFDFVANVQTDLVENEQPNNCKMEIHNGPPGALDDIGNLCTIILKRTVYPVELGDTSNNSWNEKKKNVDRLRYKQGKEQQKTKMINNEKAVQRSSFGPVHGVRNDTQRRVMGSSTYCADNFSTIQEDTMKAFLNMRIGNYSPSWNRADRRCSDRHSMSCKEEISTWKVGDQCKAPWTDGGYYLATVVNLGPADMCTVRYNDYGNIGTVPQAVLILL